jgi:outer membrane protein, adhesin transport system
MTPRLIALLICMLPGALYAETTAVPASLHDIAQSTIQNNPDVLSKWHNLRAAMSERDVARGGFFPRGDLNASTGRESIKYGDTTDFNRQNYTLTLTQMLFDGFATSNEVKRLGKAQQVRYYELLDASESAALDATKAYYDVIRYRQLMALAEDNYVQHKATYEQIVQRTKSGVGRRVDLDQAGSRLELARVNLNTEEANLHDVIARYQRVVGQMPPADFGGAITTLDDKVPADARGALTVAYQHSPALLAAIQNVEASQYQLETRRAAFMPRLDLRARSDHTSDYQGTNEERTDNTLELVLNYNFFNGGSDDARMRQYAELKYQAADLREKACRDTRQTLVIAYNDIDRLKTQGGSLKNQVSLLEKTRNAYHDQFNIGQRSLLDLLDTENELLNARRSVVNNDADLALAQARTYAGMGQLLEKLNLRSLDTAPLPVQDSKNDLVAEDLCPAEAPARISDDRSALDAKADQVLAENARKSSMQPPVAAPGAETAVSVQVRDWASAWADKDYKRYMSFYSSTFTPDGGLSREDWAQLRRSRLSRPNNISVDISNLHVRADGPTHAFAEFLQNYRSDVFSDKTNKVLEFSLEGNRWMIQRESSMPVGK